MGINFGSCRLGRFDLVDVSDEIRRLVFGEFQALHSFAKLPRTHQIRQAELIKENSILGGIKDVEYPRVINTQIPYRFKHAGVHDFRLVEIQISTRTFADRKIVKVPVGRHDGNRIGQGICLQRIRSIISNGYAELKRLGRTAHDAYRTVSRMILVQDSVFHGFKLAHVNLSYWSAYRLAGSHGLTANGKKNEQHEKGRFAHGFSPFENFIQYTPGLEKI